ncbi:hypothetical protein I7I50_07021 [Histoplasma capsulatum G186AR]|uniref:Uncharacterized protein n=1 Tax=Ajellomyces capsulatus TaxID=5037 RepID=A0A8H7Z0G6_AJECA|nr:hypothetical protein I7I52_09905 [Histoplasma capsulatum]QSS67828.1 hypothetical protein I7I50_07021 [Histoplasma capsulatum G186AR]
MHQWQRQTTTFNAASYDFCFCDWSQTYTPTPEHERLLGPGCFLLGYSVRLHQSPAMVRLISRWELPISRPRDFLARQHGSHSLDSNFRNPFLSSWFVKSHNHSPNILLSSEQRPAREFEPTLRQVRREYPTCAR